MALNSEENAAATVLGEFRESMTSEELSNWLLEQGIPDQYCKVFESKKPVLVCAFEVV